MDHLKRSFFGKRKVCVDLLGVDLLGWIEWMEMVDTLFPLSKPQSNSMTNEEHTQQQHHHPHQQHNNLVNSLLLSISSDKQSRMDGASHLEGLESKDQTIGGGKSVLIIR